MSSPGNPFFLFDEFELDTSKRLFLRDGLPVALSPKAFEVLTYLAGNPGRVIAKEELLKAVWRESFVEENNLSQQVSALRKALGDKSGYIATIPGRGYQFTGTILPAAPVEQHRSPVPMQTVHEHTHITLDESSLTAVYALTQPERISRVSWAGASAVAVVLIAITCGAWRWAHREAPGEHTEIVLGWFENATGEPAFDATLNTALAIDLKETPYLQIAGEGRARDTLKLMEHRPSEHLTPELAREVCQRINDQALIHGAISRFGKKYLVTLTAADCASGDEIVQTKAVAGGVEGVLQAVDTAAAEMREKLGEPLSSLRRFRTPLSQKMTTSLPALRVYSQAMDLIHEGKAEEAVPLLKQAIQFDPNFASAYVQLGFANNRIGQFSEAMVNYGQAYALRDHADERDRFYIDSEYKALAGPQFAMMRTEEEWAQVYPDDVTPWLLLSKQRLHLGWIEDSLDPARKAIALDPGNALGYEYLAEAQMRLGQMDAAKTTCQRTIDLKIDGIVIHGLLLTIAFYEHEDVIVEQQIAWARGTKAEPEMRIYVGRMDLAQGKLRAEEQEYRRMHDAFASQDLKERADHITARLPKDYFDVGLYDEARRVFKWTSTDDGAPEYQMALAETGQLPHAQADLEWALRSRPDDIFWQSIRGPEVKAAIALAQNKPAEAIAALELARPYDRCSFDGTIPPMLRAAAYVAAGRLPEAEAEYRKILERPYLDPLSANVALAHLGLARAESGQGRTPESRHEYQAFLTAFKNADSDLPILKRARDEYAHLPAE